MKTQLSVEFVGIPCPDYERRRQECFRLLADVFADQLIARARAQAAQRLGVPEEEIDRERHQDLPSLADLA